MPLGGHRLWVIEADIEHGRASADLAAVSLGRDGHGSLYIESAATGGCYTESWRLASDAPPAHPSSFTAAVASVERAGWRAGR